MESQHYAPTQAIACVHCSGKIRFFRFSGMSDVAPHFYCDTCSNVIFRPSDRELIRGRALTEELLELIVVDLPACPCGGQFSPEASPKCYHCHKELAHQADPARRLGDPFAIVLKGALFITDE